ncbi:hypothetical protein ACHWQZ_G008132 [Mnemiopsis leidyi]
MGKVLPLLLFLGTLSNGFAVKCPPDIRAFATLDDSKYYWCSPGKDAELRTCENGLKFDKTIAKCTEPEPLEKRYLQGSSESGPHERVSMGEAIKIGALYDVRTGFLYRGFNLWSEKTLANAIWKTDHDSQSIEYLFEDSARDKANHFGIGAQLELDFLAGLINIKGSAEFLKDYRRTTNEVRMVLKGEITGSVEVIDKFTPVDYPDLCDMVKPNSGPTHVITKVTRGLRSYLIFDKYIEKDSNSEDITGALEASVKAIPLFEIKGRVAIHTNGTMVKNVDRLNVRFYGDALLASFPTQYPQAAVAYDDTIRQGTRNTPIRYHVTPIAEFCEGSNVDVVVNKLTEDLVNSASSSLSIMRGLDAHVNALLELDPAIRYDSIKLPLTTFKVALDKFMSDYRRRLVEILPKLKAKQVEEIELVKIIDSFAQSAFSQDRAETFLESRKKEIETVTTIISNALHDPSISLSDVKNAIDNECIFKGEQSSAFVLRVLPAQDITEKFLSTSGPWSEEKAWFLNNYSKVFEIGQKKQQFEKFVKTNMEQESGKSQCFLIRLEDIQADQSEVHQIQLYEAGNQFEDHFMIPVVPPYPSCPEEDMGSDRMKIVSRRLDNDQVSGQEVLLETVTAEGELLESSVVLPNEDSLLVTGLKPFTHFRLRTRYVVHNGHSYSAVTEYLDDCITKPTSQPAALGAEEISANSIVLTWAKPETIHPAFAGSTIKYRVKVRRGDVEVASKESTGLSVTVDGLQPGTLYSVSITAEVLDDKTAGRISLAANLDLVTAPAAPAAPVAGQIQDNRARFQVKVGEITVPAGAEKELLSIKYYKMDNGQPISGSEVYYMQRLQGPGDTEIDIASFETGTTYGVQVKLLVRFGDKILGSAYSGQTVITTTSEGSPIDKLQENISQLQASSNQKLDEANSQKEQLASTLANAEARFSDAKSGGMQRIDDLSNGISQNFAGVQQKSNVLQKSRCMIVGFWIWHQSADNIKNINVNSVYDCLAACADTDGCSSASVNHVKSGNQITTRECHLGKKRNGFMLWQKNNFVSSNLYCQMTESVAIDTWKECIYENKEFSGASISSSVGISNIEECVAFCQSVEECAGVTYNRASKTCTAKNKRTGDGIQPNSNAESVSLMCLSANRGGVGRCAKNGVRFTGSVIQTTTVNSLDLCIQLCTNKHNCESVSYNASSRSCEVHNKRLGASRSNSSGWTSVNMYCLGLEHF